MSLYYEIYEYSIHETCTHVTQKHSILFVRGVRLECLNGSGNTEG